MKHTECRDCKLREGDCGHHFKMDGITNYDIPSQSACDQYDDCMFFQPNSKRTQGDLISRSELKKAFDDYIKANPNISGIFEVGKFITDNAPTVIPDIEEFDKALHKWFEEIDEWEKKNGKIRPQGDLISRSEAEKLGATCLARRNENGQLEAIISLDEAPTVEIPNYGGQVVPDTLQGWRYEERPQREWEDYDNTFYKCPECGYLLEKCCPQCQNKVILPKGGAE